MLLSSDELLLKAASERSSSVSNASVARDAVELKTLLNAIAAHLSDEAVNHILPRAAKLFITRDDQKSLWFSWAMKDRFNVDGVHASRVPFATGFKSRLINIPPLKHGLSKKEGQRLFFNTVVVYNIESTRTVETPNALSSLWRDQEDLGNLLTSLKLAPPKEPAALRNPFEITAPQSPVIDPAKEYKVYGALTFDVGWSATLTKRGSLIKPTLESVTHRTNDWSGEPPTSAGLGS